MFSRNKKQALVLLNASNIKDYPKQDLYMEFVRTTQKLSIKRFDEVIGALLKDPRIQAELPFYSGDLESMASANYFALTGIERTLNYYLQVIKAQAKKINSFIEDKEKFEQLLFQGNYTLCTEFLAEHKENFGESIWWIKANLLLLFFKQNSLDTQEFCDNILDRTGNCLLTYYLNSLIQCTHASSPIRELDRKISKALEEFEKAEIPAISWFVTKLCFPEIITLKPENLENLSLLQKFPIVDIYEFTTSAVLFSYNLDTSIKENRIPCQKFISELSNVVNDPRLASYRKHSSTPPPAQKHIETELLRKYEAGYYQELIDEFLRNIDIIRHPISFANMLSKACIRIGADFNSGKQILDDTVRNLIDIHSLSSKASQARLDIQERIVRLHRTELGIQLQAVLALAIPQFFAESVLVNVLRVADLTHLATQPLISSIIQNGRHIYGDQFHFVDPKGVPAERFARCNPLSSNDEAFDKPDESSFEIHKDFIEYKSRILISNNDIDGLIEFASKCLTHHPESYVCFPMDILISHINTYFSHSLEAIIVCHFYVRYISSEKRTLLNEIFEEYLYSQSKSKPSELFSELELKQNPALELLFFNEVCSFESLDFLDSFQSSDELRIERATILEHLYNRKLISRENYSKELEQIVRLVVMDSATSNFSRSKVYVDHVSIKRKIREEASTYYDLFKITKNNDGFDDGIFTVSERLTENGTIASGVITGQHSSLLVKIIEITHRAFLFDEAFGLDANLSSEIRHGIFSNFMLSEVDSKYLISEKNDDGTYKPIRHWHDFYSSWLIPSLMKQIDGELAWFSEQYNQLIDTAERWMKIGDREGEHCFNFSIDVGDYSEIKDVASHSHTVDEVLDAIVNLLWSKTEAGLLDLKDRINHKLKHDIEKLFTELTERLNAVRGNAYLNEIMHNIETANNNTKEIIAEITEWFARSESKSFDDQSLSRLLDIAISCFERIKGRNVKISRALPPEVANICIPGSYVNSMILAFVNLLTNATRHSGLQLGVTISIAGTALPLGYKITICNSLSTSRREQLNADFFQVINDRLNSPDSVELMRSEGGTGVAKAYHHLKTAHPAFDLKVLMENNQFCTEVTYAHVDLAS